MYYIQELSRQLGALPRQLGPQLRNYSLIAWCASPDNHNTMHFHKCFYASRTCAFKMRFRGDR